MSVQTRIHSKQALTKNNIPTLNLGLKAAEELLKPHHESQTTIQSPIAAYREAGPYLTWAEVSLSAIEHNVQEIRRLVSLNKFMFKKNQPIGILSVIKADAYGHGMREVAFLLDYLGIDYFAVSDVAEGMTLRQSGIKKPILLLENTLPIYIQHIAEFDLTPTVCTLEFAQNLNRLAERLHKTIDVHVKVDTGMGRLGVWHEEALKFFENVAALSHIKIQGLYTHFPEADTDKTFTRKQIQILHKLINALYKKGFHIPYIHAANSAALAGYKTQIFNLVRPGLMLYGLLASAKPSKGINLKPALSVHSKVIFVKDIKKGRSVSYGRTFTARKNMKVATIPIGYSDGYLRNLSNKATVLISGKRCAVLGRVTMDQIVVDVSKIDNICAGTEVVLLGQQKDQIISASELAAKAGTISYEVCCSLGNRLPRVYI